MPATRTKICGITSLEDAEHAVEAGAWAVGCIMWEGSKRRCDPATAGLVAAALRRRAEVALVFVDAPLDEVAGLVDALRPSMVQLHGDEGPVYAEELGRRTGVQVIKAGRVRSRADVQAMGTFRRVGFHLLDTYVDGAPGGTGRTWDYDVLGPRRSDVPLIVSGGLTAENVGAAIAAARPFGVDVAGGTEASPGVKDPAKVEAFLAAVAAKDAELAPAPAEAEADAEEATA